MRFVKPMNLVKELLRNTFLYPLLARVYDSFNTFRNFIHTLICIIKVKSNNRLYFFFPFYHTGGAEKVHLDILKTVSDQNPTVFFTSLSLNDSLKKEFSKYANCIYLYPYTKAESTFFSILKWVLVNKVNRNTAIVFSCNSEYFYHLISDLSTEVKCIDLIHAFVHKNEIGSEHRSISNVKKFYKRIVINEKTMQDLIEQYHEHGIADNLINRIQLIKNAVDIPVACPSKNFEGPLSIVFVSRNSPEKRVELVSRFGAQCVEKYGVEFMMIGPDLESGVPHELISHFKILGEITETEELCRIYDRAHVVIIMSSREGFPMAIMEAMAHGCAVISTDVGGIPNELVNGKHGFLISNHQTEAKILEDAVSAFDQLNSNRTLLKSISLNNFIHAKKNFSYQRFQQAYKQLLNA